MAVLTYEIANNKLWVNKKVFWILFAFTAIGIVYMRNNGSYIIIPFLVILGVVFVQYRRQIVMAAVAVVCAMAIAKAPYLVLRVEPLFQETVGIPLQQMAAVVVENGTITEEQEMFLDRLLPLEQMKKRYNPDTVDPIKWGEGFDKWFLNEHCCGQAFL